VVELWRIPELWTLQQITYSNYVFVLEISQISGMVQNGAAMRTTGELNRYIGRDNSCYSPNPFTTCLVLWNLTPIMVKRLDQRETDTGI
jgi:hypothetical protein